MLLILLASLLVSALACVGAAYLSRHDLRRAPLVSLFFILLLITLPLGTLLPGLELSTTFPSETAIRAGGNSLSFLVFGIWLSGAGVMIFKWLRDAQAFRKWMKCSTELKDESTEALFGQLKKELEMTKDIKLLERGDLTSPVVTGLIQPIVILPIEARTWSEETLRMALLHELGHVKRGDLWAAALAKFSCVIYWFNPLVHHLKKRLLNQCEYACDAWVIAKGANRRAYAHALCNVVESLNSQKLPKGVLAMAGEVPLITRVKLMAAPARKSSALLLTAFLMLTYTLGFLVTSLDLVPQGEISQVPNATEIQLRLTANPFPLD